MSGISCELSHKSERWRWVKGSRSVSLEFTRSQTLWFRIPSLPFPVWKMRASPFHTLGLSLSCGLYRKRIVEGVVSRCFAEVHSNVPDTLDSRKEGKRETRRERERERPQPRLFHGARHINSNGKRIKPPHFLARAPYFRRTWKVFSFTFALGEERSARIYRT